MGSKWRKAKLALSKNLCVYVPRTREDSPPPGESTERLSDVALLSPGNWDMATSQPMTPTPSSHGLRLSRSSSRSSKVCVSCSLVLVALKTFGVNFIFLLLSFDGLSCYLLVY